MPIFIWNRRALLQVSGLFHEIYARQSGHPGRKRILDKYLAYSWMAYRTMKYLYYTAGVLLALLPLLLSLWLQERILPFGIFLPLLDHTKSPGFEINYLFTSLLIYFAVNGWIASETYIVAHVFLKVAHCSMLNDMVEDLGGLLKEEKGKGDKRSPEERKTAEALRELASEFQRHLKFTGLFEECFCTHTIVIIVTASVIIVVCLVVLVKQFWMLGLVVVVLAMCQILLICGLGTAFETVCLRFSGQLYMMDWHLLSPGLRRHLLLVLVMAQKPHLNTIGGLQPSNLNSFMSVSTCHGGRGLGTGDLIGSRFAGHAEPLLHSDDAPGGGRLEAPVWRI